MGFDDSFGDFSTLLRVIVYGVVPLFTALQVLRLRRALHIFQLEGYKRDRFLEWCRNHKDRAWFLRRQPQKKPLVMTGRAWRILIAGTFLSLGLVLIPLAAVHLVVGEPFAFAVWGIMTNLAFVRLPSLLVAADALLGPVQARVNAGYSRMAKRKLEDVAPVVVGITGSYGKTSTKFAVRDIAGRPGQAFATPGSYNTPLGVTRAINEGLEAEHELLVVEMGAYGVGEIAELCAFVRPTIGVLTAIGPVHLERFGSMDAIKRAKYELIESLPADGIAIMNTDDLEVRALADKTTHVPVIRYGMDAAGKPDVTARDHSYGPRGTTFTLEENGDEIRAQVPLLGEHAIGQVLAGVAVARKLGVPARELGDRIASLRPVEHRLQLIKGAGGVAIIDDAYNSNPAGAAAAIGVLADLDENDSRRKVVVTPGMIELGERQYEANKNLGKHAAVVADVLIVVGDVNRDALEEGAREIPDPKAEVIFVDTLATATEKLAELKLGAGDWVLFENDLPDQYEG